MKMKQYYLYNENNEFVETNFYDKKPKNSTEIAPTIDVNFAVFNGGIWVDSRGENFEETPKIVSSIQFISQLAFEGISKDTILQVIKNLPEPDRTVAEVSYERAANFYRDNPLIQLVAFAFGKTEKQMDEIFIKASKINI